jgi:hypothetical protein
LFYIVARTAYFNETGEKKAGAYETRYLSIFDLWEADRKQARHFSRYPTATLKKLKSQGVEDAEVIEEYSEEDTVEETTPTPQVIQTANMILKLRQSTGDTETTRPTAPVTTPRPVRRETTLPQLDQETAPAPSVTNGPWRGYVHFAKASNGAERLQNMKCLDAVSFTYYYPTGQELGQVFVCWYTLKDGRVLPSLEVFADAWATLSYMLDVVQALATIDFTNFSAADLCALLERFSFRNMTT